MTRSQWEFWIDRGGTFTDVIAVDPNGKMVTHKLLSDDPKHYEDAVLHGIRHILHLHPQETLPLDKIAAIKMGTTVSTNALLERKGEKVLLAITAGFADVLRIGYQNRPKLFDLNIVLPSMLYKKVIEIQERLNAQGEVLQPLQERETYKALQKAYQQGFRSVAIVLMHSYRNAEHEKKVAEIAKEIGFTQISVSHCLAPVMKIIPRGDTTVVDAYLSPVLQQYVTQLQKTLENTPLFFMQSNGGLADVTSFQGKDSIFSGPAGGVVGMVKTSRIAGFDHVIGFDMGGTSTDVSHFAGEYERIYDWEIAGVRLKTPMMLIHTIAAGGGSILHFDGQRFTAGPDSAGAKPGPACYRQGGPLTISDCNVLLGKIQAAYFPKIFGPNGNQAIAVNLVQQKFKALANEISQATKRQHTAEEVAEGFIKVAVENMANAIKKISIQRGYDVTQYLLNCFGGAAGQHACLVADALGIKTILLHPLAGVLSAYGIGLAEIRLLREQALEKKLVRNVMPLIKQHIQKLQYAAEKELALQQKMADKKIVFKNSVHLRYAGSDTALIVAAAPLHKMRNAFYQAHHKRFGFASSKKPLIVESISVEAIIHSHPICEVKKKLIKRARADIPCRTKVNMFTQGKFHTVPVYVREDLKPGDRIRDCAIISESLATTVIEPGWQVQVTEHNHLLLTRYQTKSKKKVSTKVNPVMLEVFNNRFMTIAEQMGEVLRNTASSVNIKERLDFSCAIFDEHGELVANAPHIPVHLGSMSESVKSILKRHRTTMHPQDAFMLNSPYHGGTHLPDVTIISPVLDKHGKLLFLVGSRGHHADIGGISPGSMPAASKKIEEEGVCIDYFKIMGQGRLHENKVMKLLSNAQYPARNPKQNLADFKAQLAANACGIDELGKLIEHFGLSTVRAYMKHVRTNAKLSVEKLLNRLEEGSFSYALDDGSKIQVSITVDKKRKQATIDFTGSADQHPGNFNAPHAVCYAAVLYVLRCLIAENIPLNSGCLEPIEIIVPKNSILNPHYPAAVVAGNVETSQCIVDTLLGAVNAVAASQGTCNNFTFGNARYQYYETICGGAGAGPGFNGASAVHTHMTNTRLTDPEILEARFPVRLEKFAIRYGSGGKGKYQGGDGVIRHIRFLERMDANIISNHRKIPPYGLQGAACGEVGRQWVQRASGTIEPLLSCASTTLYPNDVFVIETPGGGGFGSCK